MYSISVSQLNSKMCELISSSKSSQIVKQIFLRLKSATNNIFEDSENANLFTLKLHKDSRVAEHEFRFDFLNHLHTSTHKLCNFVIETIEKMTPVSKISTLKKT